MTKTMSISDFLPNISGEQRHKIAELAELYKQYIDALNDGEYSFIEYLDDNQVGELGDFYEELDEMCVGFGASTNIEIIGAKEIVTSDPKRPEYQYFSLVE